MVDIKDLLRYKRLQEEKNKKRKERKEERKGEKSMETSGSVFAPFLGAITGYSQPLSKLKADGLSIRK